VPLTACRSIGNAVTSVGPTSRLHLVQPGSAKMASQGDVQELLPRGDEQLCLVGTERSDEALGLSTLGDASSRRSCRAHIDRELDLQLRGDPHEGVHSRVDLPELQARDLWLLHAQA